jgi:L-alanine-DL-glutamate epimerase-like enolase superfamily enzyme
MGVVTIHTDGGVEGHSFLGAQNLSADVDAGALLSRLKPVLIGQDPMEIGRLWYKMEWCSYVSLRAIGALDIALLDLMGRVTNQPIHRLLGSCRDSVPVYASSGKHPTPEDYASEALYWQSRGWTAYKIHPHLNAREDIEICRRVREAVGKDMVLMLDPAGAYGYEDALRVGRVLEELDYLLFEDPLPEDDIYGYVKLKQKLDIPILATERAPGGLYGMQQFVLQKATDMLRGDVRHKGGITPLIKIAHLAEAFRMKCEIHHGGNSLNNVANIHVMMAIRNCDYYEVLVPDVAYKYGLIADVEVDDHGMVHAPEGPGLGYEIDWGLVKSRTTRILQ